MISTRLDTRAASMKQILYTQRIMRQEEKNPYLH